MTTNVALWKQIETLSEMADPVIVKQGLVDSLLHDFPTLPSAARRDLQLLLQSLFATLPLIAKLTKGPDAMAAAAKSAEASAPPKRLPRMPYMD